MCGILGFSGSFDPATLRAGLDRISHRGPDDSGIFADQSSGLGLGHVRLSILDLSHSGHQPMASEDGAVVLVFNGEIYNFRELRAGLEVKGHRFRGHSDTEVLLRLYLDEGVAMLPRLNGIFAFALWDKREQLLFLARDAVGVKPLYCAATQQGFAFASEIKGLLTLVPSLACARELDAMALHRYLSFLWCPGEGTPLKTVRKLLPGEALLVRDGQIQRRWTWYQLPVFRKLGGNLDRDAAISGTTAYLRQAVKRQLVADVPVGAFLSGGLDSSAVVAFAREQNPDIQCFTIKTPGGQEEGATDDLPYARRVAKHLGVTLNVVQIDANRMADDLQCMVAQLDEPLADPAPLNVLYISQLAREQGMKVLLSGAGGDDLFTGYRRHVAVNYEPLWRWLPVGVRRGLEQSTSGLDQRNGFNRRVSKLFRGAGLDGDEHLAHYFDWAREADLLKLYTPAFRAELADGHAVDPLVDFIHPLPKSVGRIGRMLALEQRFFLADHNLIYTDKMSMAVGVEVRVPFLDLDLVEFASSIPIPLKQRGRVGKWVLKKAMEPYLPHDVIYRPKTGFGAPLRHWLRHELREWVGDVLSADTLRRRGLFNPTMVAALLADNQAGRVDAAYTIMGLACIEVWCREFMDGGSAKSASNR